MERRVLIAVILSFLVLYGYQALFVPPPPKDQGAPPVLGEDVNGRGAAPLSRSTASPPVDAVPPAARPPAITSESAERLITVDTATISAVFSNRGGRILHWRLKDYLDGNGEAVDLVPSNLPDDQWKPFSLRVDDGALTDRLNTSLYRASGDASGHVDARTGFKTLTFEYEDSGGLRARKEFRFEPRTYVVRFTAVVTDSGRVLNPGIAWGPGLGDVGATSGGGSFFTGNYVQPPAAIFHRDGDVERMVSGDLLEQPVHEGQFRFLGVDDHYFLAAAVDPGRARAEYRPVVLQGPAQTERTLLAATYTLDEPSQDVRFFFGPKQFELLRATDAELVRAINFGMFAFLAVPLLGALSWIFGFVGNWGFAIILLTILINIVVFPLRHKSVVSMRKMQLLQPQMKAIQDRYAGLKVTDPERQKMNTEIMSLYRERGVNPASGCVPMLLQMPLLFAFYSMLSQAIELRGADFGLWLHDLSQSDPWFVLPVLMAASMFWQQKITPSTADPAQQKVMMLMPLMFSVMFLWAPSGLVMYWFVSNLWAIGQQYFTNFWLGPAPVVTVRPPAERRLKNAGAGKSPGAEKGT
jgi:YidC/Oxa1 family membrane protein insertase